MDLASLTPRQRQTAIIARAATLLAEMDRQGKTSPDDLTPHGDPRHVWETLLNAATTLLGSILRQENVSSHGHQLVRIRREDAPAHPAGS